MRLILAGTKICAEQPVYVINIFPVYSGSTALTHSSDSNLFSRIRSSLIWPKQSWDFLFSIYILFMPLNFGLNEIVE